MQSYADLEEIYHKSILIEQQIKRKGSRSTFGAGSTSTRSSYLKEEKAIVEPKEFSKQFSANSDSKEKTQATTTRAREIVCFKCQGRGHIASACPNKRVMILLDNGELDSEEEKEILDSTEEHEEYAAKGDLLMIKKILNVQAKTGEEAQRENLFHTRCHVQDKVCSLIIDGGSCTNVASAYMVNKLGLTVKKHPKPYHLHWLNDEGEMRVNSQVTISLTIGQYKDDVLCDVLPMEASHILLGRPWQYDRRVTHDGSTNKYSFEFKGRKHTLVPMTPFEIYQDQKKKEKQVESKHYKQSNLLAKAGNNHRTLLSQSSIHESDHNKTLLSLSNTTPELPSGRSLVLQDYTDEYSKEKPKELLPSKEKEHQQFHDDRSMSSMPKTVNYLQQMRTEQKHQFLTEGDDYILLTKPIEESHQGRIQFGQFDFIFPLEASSEDLIFTKKSFKLKEHLDDQTTTGKGKFSHSNMNFKTNGRVPLLLKHTGSVLPRTQQIGFNGDQLGQKGGLRAEGRAKLKEPDYSKDAAGVEHKPFQIPAQLTSKTHKTNLQGKYTPNSSSKGSNLALLRADGPDLRTNPFQLGEDDVILSNIKKKPREPEHEREDKLVAEGEQLEPELVAEHGHKGKLVAEEMHDLIGTKFIKDDYTNGYVIHLYSFSLTFGFVPMGFPRKVFNEASGFTFHQTHLVVIMP